MKTINFDEFEFRAWVHEQVAAPWRKAEGKREDPDYDTADEMAKGEVEALSAMDLTCLLGRFLSL